MSFGFTARGRFPLSEFGSLSVTEHEELDSLVHNLAESNYQTFTYTGQNLTSSINWTDSGMTLKVREATFTYNVNGTLAAAVKKQYNDMGDLVQTLTLTFSYTMNKLSSIDVARV